MMRGVEGEQRFDHRAILFLGASHLRRIECSLIVRSCWNLEVKHDKLQAQHRSRQIRLHSICSRALIEALTRYEHKRDIQKLVDV